MIKGKFDDREWRKAMELYVRTSKRDAQQIADNKARDLMFKAARETPRTSLTQGEFKARLEVYYSGAMTTKRTIEKFGAGNWSRADWEQMRGGLSKSDIKAAIGKRVLGKGFMRSAFYKAIKQIPKRGDANRPGAENKTAPRDRFTKSRARVLLARKTLRTATSFNLDWTAKKQQGDQRGKQKIVDRSINHAKRIVARDMMQYVYRKTLKNAKQVSWTGRKS
jgi:hypothetical protein